MSPQENGYRRQFRRRLSLFLERAAVDHVDERNKIRKKSNEVRSVICQTVT